MDVFNLLSYINKISLFAFFVTTLVVGYQIYVIKKEKSKEKTPTIPDFKENNNLNLVANYTSLPSSLTKKEFKPVNYSKLILLIISLLTIVIIIFVVTLIKKNGSTSKQTLDNTIISTPSPTVIAKIIISPIPTLNSEPTTKPTTKPTTEPTEIVLAQSPSLTPSVNNPTGNPEVTIATPQTLPETGSLGKGLLIIGVAISTVFFSFWF